MLIDFNEDFLIFNVDLKGNLQVLEIFVPGNQSYVYHLHIIKYKMLLH